MRPGVSAAAAAMTLLKPIAAALTGWSAAAMVVMAMGGIVPAAAAPAVPRAACTDDAVPEGPMPSHVYRVCFPADRDRWNGDLVVYAPGYTSPFPDRPPEIAEEQLMLGEITLPQLFTSLGYAFATTSYPRNGTAIVEGVADVVQLVDFFEGRFGEADHVYLVGASQGAAVTARAIEQHMFIFDGGLAACGPVGNFRSQITYFGDFRVLFDYFFPEVLPGSPVAIPTELMENWDTGDGDDYVTRIAEAVANDPAAAEQLLAVSGAPVDDDDASSALKTIIDVLWYNVFATADLQQQLGGQPYDNSRRWYRGSANDLAMNLGVQRVKRFAADQPALDAIAAAYETTGDLQVPLVTLHTTRDPIIGYFHEPAYRRKIVANRDAGHHLNLPIDRYGHCAFTAREALAAFAVLVGKVTGRDASALPDAVRQP